MSHAALDRTLALLILAIGGTGLMALKAGTPDTGWVFTVHGLVAGALLAAIVWKLRRSWPRAARAGRWGRLIVGSVVAALGFGALIGGFLWVVAGTALTFGGWTVLTLHAWLGLALVPLVGAHLLPRRWRVVATIGGPGISRRNLLASGGLALAGVAAFGGAALIDRGRGGARRFTGSRSLRPGGIPPATTFYGEAAPLIDHRSWRLTVARDDGIVTSVDITALGAVDETELDAVLDCTSGWSVATTWRGVTLPALFAAIGGVVPDRPLRVVSLTGWSTVLSPDEVSRALLATGVAGHDLPRANGAPCRLVVPGRRGLDWVKWVDRVEVA